MSLSLALDILDVVERAGGTDFLSLVRRANLSKMLQNQANFTLFMPTNVAFQVRIQLTMLNFNKPYKSNQPSYDIISTYCREKGVPTFQFRTVSSIEVEGILDRLPTGKAPGYDSISGHCVKSVKQDIGAPLTTIVNRMFTEHSFENSLSIWKRC